MHSIITLSDTHNYTTLYSTKPIEYEQVLVGQCDKVPIVTQINQLSFNQQAKATTKTK